MPTTPQAFAIALQHFQSGRLQAAEQICRQILAVEPDQADALHILGLIAYQIGKHETALQCIARAIELQGNRAFFHSNLGEAYRALGRIPEAVAACRRALELDPDFAVAHFNLGNALKDQGKWEEATACYQRAVELKPDSAEAHNNLGLAFREQGKLNEAAACCRRAVELRPSYAEAQGNLGLVFKDQGKLGEAVACYRRALQLNPNAVAAHNNLGVVLKDQGKLDEAVACYRRALQLNPSSVAAHNNLGVALKEQGKPDEAVACYRRALELKPDFAEAHGGLGTDLQEMGDLAGAEDCFRTALRHNPRLALAHYQLAVLLGGKLPEKDLAAQRRLLEEGGLTDAQRSLLHFGLAHALDARGEYPQAAEHANMANALRLAEAKAAGWEYSADVHSALVDRIIGEFVPEFFARREGFGVPSQRPVFVVGLPRSGTTLVEQILASHSQVFGAGELTLARDAFAAAYPSCRPGDTSLSGRRCATLVDEGSGLHPSQAQGQATLELSGLDRAGAERLAQRHLEELERRNATALRVVDKLPDNYLYLGFLVALFPRARFIHCRRDLRDVAVSCWMTNFSTIRWASAAGHIAARFRDYQRLMDHWRVVLPAPILDISYEETVGDLEAVAHRLVAFCGLSWEPGCLQFQRTKRPIRTASATQVRRPIFTTSVGRWRHYEESLAALLSAIPGGNGPS